MQNVIMTDQIHPDTTTVVSKETAKEAPIKFGFSWISAPTPQKIKNIFRIILYTAGFTSLILPMFPEIPENVALLIANWALRLIMVAHAASKFFGIDLTGVIPPEVTSKN